MHAPARGNRRLQALLDAVDGDLQVKAWWHAAGVNAERLHMSDHSWVHIQIVLNIALRLSRLLFARGVTPSIVADHGLEVRDAEVVIAGAALLHCVGMSIHRIDHEAYSLFLTADKLPRPARADVYDGADALDRRRRDDARDHLAPLQGRAVHDRGRDPARRRRAGHGPRALARAVRGRATRTSTRCRPTRSRRSTIGAGEDKAVRVEIAMSNSAGIFQVDEGLGTKLRGTPLEQHIEVVARIEAEHEQRLVPIFRL